MNITFPPRIARVSFQEKLDLASEKVGGKTLETNDEFFAPMENLLKVAPAIFIADKYVPTGKWMDGWESRRKRNLGPGNDHDWCIIRLGIPGIIEGVNVDTAFFTGNFPEYCALDALESTDGKDPSPASAWTEILPKSKLLGGTENLFPILSTKRFTHVRLRIFPDGGVARLRVHGRVVADEKTLASSDGKTDFAAAANGGVVVASNDSYFGHHDQLIYPGRAANMGEGWETKRKRGPGFDWIVVRLAATGAIQKIEVDTHFYKGNFPDMASIEVLTHPSRDLSPWDCRDRTDLKWTEILGKTKLKADHNHVFEAELKRDLATKVDYVRLNIYPDGGISRLRVYCKGSK
ncbi:MAG: allantoicase [Bdellovibrionales bacterium]|nr:allantoicase [Bdellovibrionales bacterium]